MKLVYWSREIAGWLLILLGLYTFWTAYQLLTSKMIFQASPLVLVGFVIFRGGIHVLKVAVAAQAARSLPDAAVKPARRSLGLGAKSIGPTPPKTVLPGPKPGSAAGSGKS